MNKLLISFLVITWPVMAFGQTHWQQTSGGVAFTIKNRGSDVHGHFGSMKTTLVFSPENLGASSLKGSVDVTSISTGIDKRDGDLKKENYFNADKYKLIEVSSTKLSKKGTQYTGTFKVTIKGVSKEVEIPFTFTQNGNEAEFKASFTINRRDYNVGGKSGLGMFLSDDVQVNVDVKAKK